MPLCSGDMNDDGRQRRTRDGDVIKLSIAQVDDEKEAVNSNARVAGTVGGEHVIILPIFCISLDDCSRTAVVVSVIDYRYGRCQ